MEKVNEYIFNVFNMIRITRDMGLMKKPLTLSIAKQDKKVLKNTYNLYKIYTYGIGFKKFKELSAEQSVNTGKSIITSAVDIAEAVEKTIVK